MENSSYHRQSVDVIRTLEDSADFIYGRVMQTENEDIRDRGIELVERINHILGYELKGEKSWK